MGFSVHLQHRVLAFGQYNFLGARLPVPSSLNLPLWRSKLRGYDDYAACDFLEFGWPVGLNYASSLSTDQFSRNHKGATDFPSAVDSYLSLELERGAVIGPFSSNPFSRPIVISPLNSVPKPQSFERQMILNLNRSIDPFDYPLLGYQWNGELYFDVVLPMVLKTAAMACQRSTSAVCHMPSQDGCLVVNYLNDFIGISSPDKAFRDYDTCGLLLRDLGLQESPSKACPSSPVITCLGVEVNSLALTLSVTPERLHELETLLLQWTTQRSATKSELQSLVGKLYQVCSPKSFVFVPYSCASATAEAQSLSH